VIETGTRILIGDVRAKLRELRSQIDAGAMVRPRCVVTSPPYWGLRDYGTEPQIWGGRDDCAHEWGDVGSRHRGGPPGKSEATAGRDQSARAAVGDVATGCFCQQCGAWRGELGLEPTPELFVEHIVEVFRLVRDVLADDGTCWVNMGDCYLSNACADKNGDPKWKNARNPGRGDNANRHYRSPVLKAKDLVGQPWRVAFALQADGWFLRSDIIWHKPNPMPESISDRPTKSHEYLFLLTKSPRYYYDADAIKEPVSGNAHPRGDGLNPKARRVVFPQGWASGPGSHSAIDHNRITPGKVRPKQNASFAGLVDRRNKRTVWTIPTEPYPEAHYATFPTKLVVPCILAGSQRGDVVLDPFGGSGTVGQVAQALGRNSVLVDLNPVNEVLMRARIAKGMRNPKAKKPRVCETMELRLEGAA
jgi:hypothetical protein